MKAGKNTPQSVLRYIDTMMERYAPADPLELARELGYGPKAIAGLQEKHGDKLLAYLERVKRTREEQLEYMASQHGQEHPQQYVGSPHGAIDDAPVIPGVWRERYALEGRERDRARLEEVIVAALEVQALIRSRMDSPEFREMTALTVRRMERDLKKLIERTKRMAA